jgi:hypothetical protein
VTREEVAGGYRKCYNEELNNFDSSPNITVTKPGRMIHVEHAARMSENAKY